MYLRAQSKVWNCCPKKANLRGVGKILGFGEDFITKTLQERHLVTEYIRSCTVRCWKFLKSLQPPRVVLHQHYQQRKSFRTGF